MTVNLTPDILQRVTKPTRYTGGEYNAVHKEWDKVKCKFALSLPDIYEVGMSNLGLAILYEVLNERDDSLAERAYAPWTDMEEVMRRKDLPLFSLESHHALADFDFWGFSLQYEMIYTNVLNMLDLARIPLFADERRESDPLIAGGGPCVYNVEPMADFFDFFVVGEGEEVLGEVVDVFVAWQATGKTGGRKEILRRLAALDGIYVPSFYRAGYDAAGNFVALGSADVSARPQIKKRLNRDMDAAKSLTKPLVPYLDIVHNRLMLELFRGCSRGCRFCQAGMCYRPVRERSEGTLRRLAERMAAATGYDEMSLTSLSSADYSCLLELTENLQAEFGRRLNLSLPSLRIDSFSVDLAKRLHAGRKSGLTFAPEAGTQRLRDVINKGVTEDDLLSSCAAAFEQGWQKIKLYFMMGLPTETDEDILGIADLARKVARLYRKVTGKGGVKVTVSVSCFVPKPYTPFQWFGQITADEFKRRQQLLKENITDRSITFNYHDAELSSLEGVLARGDRRLSKVIFRAWQNGAKFDGWSDLFDYDAWQRAFVETKIDPKYYNERERDHLEPLPWRITSPGVSAEFLEREWQRALRGERTQDCRRGKCEDCGVCFALGAKVVDHADDKKTADERGRTEGEYAAENEPGANAINDNAPLFVYRVEITKGAEIAYLSHLEYAALLGKAVLRAKLPVAYSQGFHPHMKIGFASALSVGVTGRAEYLDLVLTEKTSLSEIIDRLNAALPPGARARRIKEIDRSYKSLSSAMAEAVYEAIIPRVPPGEDIHAGLERFNQAPSIIVTRVTPKRTAEKNIVEYLRAPLKAERRGEDLILTMRLKSTDKGSIKPGEVLSALKENFCPFLDIDAAIISRTAILGENGRALIDLDG